VSAVATETEAVARRPLMERSAQRLFEPFEVTLEDRVLGAWEALTAGRFAECPVCHDPLGLAGCETCGSELS